MRVAVLGSCVTRDAFRIHPPFGLELCAYVSRTSFGSLFAGTPPELIDAVRRPAQNWEEMMVQADICKTGLTSLLDSKPDLIVIDFIDERNPLLVRAGHAVSWSAGLTRFGYRAALAGRYRKIGITSEEFQLRWLEGVQRFNSLTRCQLVLNRVYLTNRLVDGCLAGLSSNHNAELERMNSMLPKMYATFEKETGCDNVVYPSDSLCVDPKHRWGKAPYHYTKESYFHLSRFLESLV